MAPRHSTGNIFRDLGFSREEAGDLKIRADLMIELTKLIEAQNLTQGAAAKLLGVPQPRISDLLHGKIDRFSVDSLIGMLGHAGQWPQSGAGEDLAFAALGLADWADALDDEDLSR